MKDRLFFTVLFVLIAIYVGNDLVKSGQLESVLNGSKLKEIYLNYSAKETQNEPTSSHKKVNQEQASKDIKVSTNLSGLSVDHFRENIIKPDWFNSVEAPIANTSEDVTNVWQSKKRCCESKRVLQDNNREFYKTCYRAIENHFSDEELVVKCLWLMDSGASREQSKKIKRYLVSHFSHHKKNISRCANCAPGDTVARVTLELARMQRSQGSPEESIKLIESVLDQRRDEISPWVKTEIYTALARWYANDDRARRERILEALKNLENQSRFEDNGVERRLPALKKHINSFIDRQ
jgi:hypothetical protein